MSTTISIPTTTKLSMIAITTGYIMQHPITLTTLTLGCLGTICIGATGLSNTISVITVSYSSLLSGLLSIPMIFAIYKAPFNLVKILDSTLNQLQEYNKQYELSNQKFDENNRVLQQENYILQGNNKEYRDNLDRHKKINQGLNEVIKTLSLTLTQGSEKQQELLSALESIYKDIENATEKGVSQFMSLLLRMDELHDKLNKTLKDNQSLSNDLQETLDDLRSLLNDQKQHIVNDKLHELVNKIDKDADGPHGLRDKLQNKNLSDQDYTLLLNFLIDIDDILKIHDDIEQEHYNTKNKLSRKLITLS